MDWLTLRVDWMLGLAEVQVLSEFARLFAMLRHIWTMIPRRGSQLLSRRRWHQSWLRKMGWQPRKSIEICRKVKPIHFLSVKLKNAIVSLTVGAERAKWSTCFTTESKQRTKGAQSYFNFKSCRKTREERKEHIKCLHMLQKPDTEYIVIKSNVVHMSHKLTFTIMVF